MRRAQQIIAVVAMIYTVAITIYLWMGMSSQQPIFPGPGPYLVEIILLGLIAAAVSLLDIPVDSFVLWISAGIFLTFVVLGAMSIGPFYFPTLVLLIIAATFSEFHHKGRIWLHVGCWILAAVFQGFLMFLVLLPSSSILH